MHGGRPDALVDSGFRRGNRPWCWVLDGRTRDSSFLIRTASMRGRSKTFQSSVRVFRPGRGEQAFVLPAWMWNGHEWAAMSQAQPGAQRPLLMQALRHLRSGGALREPLHVQVVRQVRLFRSRTAAYIADGTGASYTDFVPLLNCCQLFSNLQAVMQDFADRTPDGHVSRTTSRRVGRKG